jgi:plastocyanin
MNNFLRTGILIFIYHSVALSPVLAQEQSPGSIRGKINIRAMIKPDMVVRERGSHAYGMSSMTHATDSLNNEFGNVVVSLENREGKQTTLHSPTKATLDQRNAEFIPHVLPIQRGTVVEFVNRDNTYHNVFSLSPTKKFNIGRRPTGEAVPIQFDKTGVVQIFCDIHSHMSATILVLDTPYFVHPDESGNYVLENIPVGIYTLKVWHERFTNQVRVITITPGAHIVENFILD